jgi:hypothetical protein
MISMTVVKAAIQFLRNGGVFQQCIGNAFSMAYHFECLLRQIVYFPRVLLPGRSHFLFSK